VPHSSGELPFLDMYRGESLEALILLEGQYRTDSLVLAIEQALFDKQRLSEAERTVIVIMTERLSPEPQNHSAPI